MKDWAADSVVLRELEGMGDPVGLFECLERRPYCFFLDSSLSDGKTGRYSFIGAEPFMVFRSMWNRIELIKDGVVERTVGDPLDCLKKLLDERRVTKNELPFAGGAVGYFSYDLWETLYNAKVVKRNELGMWDIHVGFYDTA
ncbi:MAG: aminodeoxychorismate synthase, component I, partial [Candidatus Altiarchaeota archaeon]|nr:aminodeoxychorismate synthase, component I [Candidatus Altiarchaeota archaeon]